MRVAILISGGGSNMVALIQAMRAGGWAEPCLVLSNNPTAAGLEKAQALGVPAQVLDHREFPTREAFDTALSETLREAGADLICCAGFMRVLGPTFVAAHSGRILNIHPSLLPLFPGLDTHKRALEAGVAIHGCTVHEVTPELDGGPILGQAAVPVLGGDTAESLAQRVLRQEHRLYPAVLQAICAGTPLKDAPIALLADA
ncbi:MAG: phosphoribosylglycinamide formyltransferase [Pseudomonadota bacterium]